MPLDAVAVDEQVEPSNGVAPNAPPADPDPAETQDWLDQQVIERLIRLRDEPNLDQRLGSFLAKEIRQLLDEYQQREET